MRICLYSRVFHPSVGGIERSTAILAAHLHRQGVGVCVVTETPAPGPEPEQSAYPVLRQPSFRQLCRTIAECDLVHANGYSLRVLPWAYLFRRPLVYTHAGYQAICPNGTGWYAGMRQADFRLGHCLAEEYRRFGWRQAIAAGVRTAVHRFCLPLAAGHICLCQRQLQRIHPPRGELIYLACDPEVAPSPVPQSTGRFAYFGRLVGEKGVDVLLEALAKCHAQGYPFGLDVFGDGPALPALRALALRLSLGDGVTFQGFRSGQALRQAMTAAWIVVIPTTCEEAGATLAVELLTCGKAVIASRWGATGEIIGACGLLFENGDPHDLAERMLRLAQDDVLRRDLEKRGPTLAAKYSIETIGRQHLELYERVLRRKGATP